MNNYYSDKHDHISKDKFSCRIYRITKAVFAILRYMLSTRTNYQIQQLSLATAVAHSTSAQPAEQCSKTGQIRITATTPQFIFKVHVFGLPPSEISNHICQAQQKALRHPLVSF